MSYVGEEPNQLLAHGTTETTKNLLSSGTQLGSVGHLSVRNVDWSIANDNAGVGCARTHPPVEWRSSEMGYPLSKHLKNGELQ